LAWKKNLLHNHKASISLLKMLGQEELLKFVGLCIFILPFIIVIQQLLAVSSEDEQREKRTAEEKKE